MNVKLFHIADEEEKVLVHARNFPCGQQDHTLCGDDIPADRDVSVYLGETNEPITCRYCLAIINYCKSL